MVWCGVFVLTSYSVWVWAGLRPSLHQYAFYGAVALAGLLLVAGPGSARLAILRDPVFWPGLLFNAYLVLQWSNAGRKMFFDAASNAWMYTEPPRSAWPYAFNSADAWQMITWFFPAWILLTAVRSSHFTQRSARRLLLFLVASAGLLALFGLVQYQSGTKSVYWVTPFSAGFFASFVYRNHAASFFGLMASVSAGVFFWHAFYRQLPGRACVLFLAGSSMLLSLLGLIFCGSRAAVFFAAALAMFFVVYGFINAWRSANRIKRVHISVTMLAVIAAMTMAVGGFAKDAIVGEFKPKPIRRVTGEYEQPGQVHLTLNLDLRVLMAQTAWQVWKKDPWFGVGGWGYKYLAAFHLPEHQWWVVKRDGFANVHLDALQFLVEFGLVGLVLLLLIVAILLVSLMRNCPAGHPLLLMAGAGLALVVVHSMIDLPYRSPGILYHWLLVLALVPRVIERESLNSKIRCG